MEAAIVAITMKQMLCVWNERVHFMQFQPTVDSVECLDERNNLGQAEEKKDGKKNRVGASFHLSTPMKGASGAPLKRG